MRPVAEERMQMDNELFFLRGEGAAFEIRPEIVNPPETATLAAALQAGIPRHLTPTPLAVGEHVMHKLFVFLRRPQPFPKLSSNNVVTAAAAAVAAAVVVVIVVAAVDDDVSVADVRAVLAGRELWLPHS